MLAKALPPARFKPTVSMPMSTSRSFLDPNVLAPAAFIKGHVPLSANQPYIPNPVAPAISIDVVRLVVEVPLDILKREIVKGQPRVRLIISSDQARYVAKLPFWASIGFEIPPAIIISRSELDL